MRTQTVGITAQPLALSGGHMHDVKIRKVRRFELPSRLHNFCVDFCTEAYIL